MQPECENTTANLADREKQVEDELNFLINCSQYKGLRQELFNRIDISSFQNVSDHDMFVFLLTTKHVARNVSQFIVDAFDTRPIKYLFS